MRHLITAFLLLAGGAAFAADPVDAIVGKVGDDIIMKSEVDRQVQLYRMQVPTDPTTDDSLRKAALENIIEGKVMVLEARRESVAVADADVEEQINQAIQNLRRNFPSEDSFRMALKREGTTVDKLKEKYRSDTRERMMIQRLIDKRVRPKAAAPTSREVEAFYATHKDSIPDEPEKVQLQHILIVPKIGQAAETRGQDRARAAMAELRAGKSFSAVAAKYSDDPGSSGRGGDLGWFGRGAMVPQFDAAVFGLKPGETTKQPVRTQFGFHIIRLAERNGDQVRASHILVMVKPSAQDIGRARKTIDGLRSRIAAGEDFGTVARTYSHDNDSKARGGDLGLVPVEAFPEEVKNELAAMKEAEVSDVIETETGYHLVKLVKREPARRATFESVREQLTEYLKNKKMQDEYNKWMKDLKGKHYIERNL